MKQTKNILIAFLFVFAFVFVGAGSALAAASVTTDKSDYRPDSTVNITGSGFQASETVQLQVMRIDVDENSGPEHNP
jgi:cell division septal protein FtsQ